VTEPSPTPEPEARRDPHPPADATSDAPTAFAPVLPGPPPVPPGPPPPVQGPPPAWPAATGSPQAGWPPAAARPDAGDAGRALGAGVVSLVTAAVAMGIGGTRFAVSWMAALDDRPLEPDSWVYQPGWAIVQVAFALIAVAAALIAVTGRGGRRAFPVLAAVVAAAVLGWCVNDGAYQVITSTYSAPTT